MALYTSSATAEIHNTCTETLMSLLGVKQQLMVVQPAVESVLQVDIQGERHHIVK